jgi:hypothetical protein
MKDLGFNEKGDFTRRVDEEDGDDVVEESKDSLVDDAEIVDIHGSKLANHNSSTSRLHKVGDSTLDSIDNEILI